MICWVCDLHTEWPSYWQPAAPERKRAKYYQRLFTVEPARQESHSLAWTIGILAFVLLLAGSSELILRAMGFGNPIVYRVDPRVGYYPAPNQDVHRYGGRIHINAFGMRSRDVTAAKPAGTFRILMLGDSTLYGGSYIDQSQMYATRLEALLNQKPQRVAIFAAAGGSPLHGSERLGTTARTRLREGIRTFPCGFGHGDGPARPMPIGHAMALSNCRFLRKAIGRISLGRNSGSTFGGNTTCVLTGAVESLNHGRASRKMFLPMASLRGWGLQRWHESRVRGVDFEFLPNEDEARQGHGNRVDPARS